MRNNSSKLILTSRWKFKLLQTIYHNSQQMLTKPRLIGSEIKFLQKSLKNRNN